ncbi:hypothetical protein K449DRAFT_381483 [Hypoxylon sp. EC38]|nr:hypothetical protein K449DRAFT_381483 [Hypoxylon sp. EC38]
MSQSIVMKGYILCCRYFGLRRSGRTFVLPGLIEPEEVLTLHTMYPKTSSLACTSV